MKVTTVKGAGHVSVVSTTATGFVVSKSFIETLVLVFAVVGRVNGRVASGDVSAVSAVGH